MQYDALNHRASYFPFDPLPQIHSLPFFLWLTPQTVSHRIIAGWLQVGFSWRTVVRNKKKRLENSSSAPLCFGHIQRLHSFRTTATLGGTSHNSNSPSARNDNNFPFCKTLGASTFLVSSVNSTHTCP